MNTGEVTWTWLYTDNWTVADSRLHGVVCRQRPELWPTVGYMKPCVDRDLNCGWQLVTWSCV